MPSSMFFENTILFISFIKVYFSICTSFSNGAQGALQSTSLKSNQSNNFQILSLARQASQAASLSFSPARRVALRPSFLRSNLAQLGPWGYCSLFSLVALSRSAPEVFDKTSLVRNSWRSCTMYTCCGVASN
jgi:hypothetical protein